MTTPISPSDVVPVLATASASLRRILGEDVQDDKASPSTYNGPPPPTLHTRTVPYLPPTGTSTYARREWLGQPCRTPDHGLHPLRRQWGLWDPERHRPSSTFHATPPRAVLHGPLSTYHNGRWRRMAQRLLGEAACGDKYTVSEAVIDTTLDTMALPAVRA